MYGCAHVVTEGRNFNSSLRSEITLNKSSKDEIVKLFGKPSKISNASINGQTFEIYYYEPSVRGEYPKKPDLRMMEIKFQDDRVQAYQLFSTFQEDFMTFDQNLMEQVIINRTSASDVLKLFGPPHGRALRTATVFSAKAKDIDNIVEIWSYRGGTIDPREIEHSQTFESLFLICH